MFNILVGGYILNNLKFTFTRMFEWYTVLCIANKPMAIANSYLHLGIFSSAFLLWHTEKCVHYIQYLKSILCFYSLEIGNTEIYKKK